MNSALLILQRANDEWHREIYLSDARKVEPAKLKTVLRVQVKSMQFKNLIVDKFLSLLCYNDSNIEGFF